MNHAGLVEVVTSEPFKQALSDAARRTQQMGVEAGFAVFEASDPMTPLTPDEETRLVGSRLVSEVVDSTVTQQEMIGDTVEAMVKQVESIRVLRELNRGDQLPVELILHSHPADPQTRESVADRCVPSLDDLEAYEEEALVSPPGLIEGILALGAGRVAYLLLYWKTTDVPNTYQAYSGSRAPSAERMRVMMQESSISSVVIRYNLEQRRYVGNVALQLASLFPANN